MLGLPLHRSSKGYNQNQLGQKIICTRKKTSCGISFNMRTSRGGLQPKKNRCNHHLLIILCSIIKLQCLSSLTNLRRCNDKQISLLISLFMTQWRACRCNSSQSFMTANTKEREIKNWHVIDEMMPAPDWSTLKMTQAAWSRIIRRREKQGSSSLGSIP